MFKKKKNHVVQLFNYSFWLYFMLKVYVFMLLKQVGSGTMLHLIFMYVVFTEITNTNLINNLTII